MKKPLISVITVCYNEREKMGMTCESVVNQNYKNFEWIVIDGKSTDETLKILKRYRRKMNVFISEKDEGPYNAMNKGIKKAKGKYILFLNGGDYLVNKSVLKRASEFILRDKSEADIYYGDAKYSNGELVTFKKSKLSPDFFLNKTISHQSSLIRKKLFSKYGDYNPRYKIVADFDFWIKTIVVHKVKTKYLPLIIAVFDLGGMSTKTENFRQHLNERIYVLKKYNLINYLQEKIILIKWATLNFLKKIKVYSIIRKSYRRIIKR